MDKEDLITLITIYNTIKSIDTINLLLNGSGFVPTLGEGVFGKICMLEELIMKYATVEVADTIIADTYSLGLWILNSDTIVPEEKADLLLGKKAVKEFFDEIKGDRNTK